MNIVTSAVPFLRAAPDARSAGMGDIGIATNSDANAAFYNMGKLAFNRSNAGIGVTYTPWLRELDLKDLYLLSAAGFVKLDDMQAISGAVRYFSKGNLQFTDENGNNTNTFKPTDLAIEGGYSRKLSDEMGVGVSIKYIHSKLANNAASMNYKSGNSVAADLGFFYSPLDDNGQGWNLGASLSNLGAKIGYSDNADQKEFLPSNLGLGAVYTRVFNDANELSFGVDINKLLVPTPPDQNDSAGMATYRDKGVVGSVFRSFGDAPNGFREEVREFQFGFGAEYTYNQTFSLRAGYFAENERKGNRQYLTVGAGFRYNVAAVNFSYLVPSQSWGNNNALSNTLRFSLLFDFYK
jgi:hypothetical protein